VVTNISDKFHAYVVHT